MTLLTKNILNYLYKFFDGLIGFGYKYILWFVVFVAPIHPFLFLTYALLLFDFLTGISKAVYVKEPLTSKRMRDTTIKFVFYSVAILAAYFIDIVIFAGMGLYLTKLIGGFICLTEFKSLLENVSVLTGVDLWMMVQTKVTDYFEAKIKPDDKDKNTNSK